MKVKLLECKEDFEEIEIGDLILVHWSDYYTRRTEKIEEVMFYKIANIQKNEIICNRKYNHFFNYSLYLDKKSNALEVYKVEV